jgi:hypothetical protein
MKNAAASRYSNVEGPIRIPGYLPTSRYKSKYQVGVIKAQVGTHALREFLFY